MATTPVDYSSSIRGMQILADGGYNSNDSNNSYASVAPAAVQAGGDILGTLASIAYNELTYGRNMKAFKENRSYNEPVNQMARLKAAGLNPSLIYSNGVHQNTVAPPQSQPMEVSLPGNVLSRYYEMKSMLADYRNKEMQNNLLQANTNLIRQKVYTEQQNTFMKFINNILDDETFSTSKEMRRYKAELMLKQIKNAETLGDNLLIQGSIAKKQREWMEEGIPVSGGDKILQWIKFAQSQFNKFK